MKTTTGFDYSYNGQAIVDDTTQVIITTDMTQRATEVGQLVPMHETMTGQLRAAGIWADPAVSLADAGYCSNSNLTAAQEFPSTVLIATGRQRRGEAFTADPAVLPENASAREVMAYRLRQPEEQAHYARRKAIVEPVFGQMKTRQQAGQSRLRGLAAARCEWVLHAVCHNLRKLRAHIPFETGSGMIAPA